MAGHPEGETAPGDHQEMTDDAAWTWGKAYEPMLGSRQLRLLADTIPAFVAYVDTHKHYRFVNKTFSDWYDLDREKVTGMHARDVLGDELFRFVKPYMDAALRGEPQSFEYELYKRGGRSISRSLHVTYTPDRMPDGTLRGFVVVGSDVTERENVQRQLRESEVRFRFMAESMPQKIFTVSAAGQIDYLNPQWEQYSGVPISKLLQGEKVWMSMVHPDDIRTVDKTWRHAFRKQEQVELEFRLRRHDGEFRWHIGRMKPMELDEGQKLIWVGSLTDVHDMRVATERRRELEVRTAALTEQRGQLLALNQAKDEFISLASHQLRTPATGVKQYLSMLLQGFAGELTGDQRLFLQTAYESNERQINIVNDLLQVARIDAGKVRLHPRQTDIARLVKNVVNEHLSQFQSRKQEVVVRIKTPKMKAKVDDDRIHMVLDNIIDNASKYTPDGKTITVTAEIVDGLLKISVTDQGVGIGREDRAKIFQKFSRLESPLIQTVEGSGLGLYWAQKIVDLHGGTINVKSKVGVGTTFTVSLPAAR
jgi:PAS domain S-box-containing protein